MNYFEEAATWINENEDRKVKLGKALKDLKTAKKNIPAGFRGPHSQLEDIITVLEKEYNNQ